MLVKLSPARRRAVMLLSAEKLIKKTMRFLQTPRFSALEDDRHIALCMRWLIEYHSLSI